MYSPASCIFCVFLHGLQIQLPLGTCVKGVDRWGVTNISPCQFRAEWRFDCLHSTACSQSSEYFSLIVVYWQWCKLRKPLWFLAWPINSKSIVNNKPSSTSDNTSSKLVGNCHRWATCLFCRLASCPWDFAAHVQLQRRTRINTKNCYMPPEQQSRHIPTQASFHFISAGKMIACTGHCVDFESSEFWSESSSESLELPSDLRIFLQPNEYIQRIVKHDAHVNTFLRMTK